jgi:hypothetical protein
MNGLSNGNGDVNKHKCDVVLTMTLLLEYFFQTYFKL